MLIISHSQDADGILSAALAVRKAKIEKEGYNIILIDYPEYDILIGKIKESKEGRIMILDIGPSHERINEVVEALKNSKSFITWIDHHTWKENEKKEVSKYCNLIVGKNSTAFIFSRIFFNDAFSRRLASIAEDTDFFRNKLKISIPLAQLITYLNATSKEKLKELVEKFSEEKISLEEIEKALEKGKEEIEKARERMKKSLRVYEKNKKRIGIVEMENLLNSSIEGNNLMKEKKLDLCIMVFKDEEGYRISIRGEKALELATILGGGGHKNAAGAFLRKNDVFKVLERNISLIFENSKYL
ncbi:MAG: hypothetical protein ACP5FX_02380 [Candidatus Micrarchaeia archaeon]